MKDSGLKQFAKVLLAVGLLAGAVVGYRTSAASEEVIPILKTKTGTYTNVTITARTETVLCILHDGGVGNVYLEDLEPEAYALVDYVPPEPTGDKIKHLATEQAAKVVQALNTTSEGPDGERLGPEQVIELHPLVALFTCAFGLLVYLFVCYCHMLICKKTGQEPGLLVWLPFLQIIPLFRAAGMSWWWVLGLFGSLLNFVVQGWQVTLLVVLLNLSLWVVWCFKIVSARGKSVVWAFLLLVPLANLIAFLYLAFSSGEEPDSETPAPPRVTGLAIRPV